MFRLTIPLVAGIFVSDHFFQGALPVLVSGTGILGCLIGLIVLMKWQGYLSRWLFGRKESLKKMPYLQKFSFFPAWLDEFSCGVGGGG